MRIFSRQVLTPQSFIAPLCSFHPLSSYSFFMDISYRCVSPNYSVRKEAPSLIILHYTASTGSSALNTFMNPSSKCSAHYLIHETGAIHALVPLDKVAWHAGKSFWKGRSNVNGFSIGIELANKGWCAKKGFIPYTKPQLDACKELLAHLQTVYGIKPEGILGHSDVAPGRKIDPGPFFPWKAFAEEGIGIWPVPFESSVLPSCWEEPSTARAWLETVGYNPEPTLTNVLRAFQWHFLPEKDNNGVWDFETALCLLGILHTHAYKFQNYTPILNATQKGFYGKHVSRDFWSPNTMARTQDILPLH